MAADLPVRDEKFYIGDGVYAKFDGFAVVLSTERLGSEGEPNEEWIALEPAVYRELVNWIGRHRRLKEHMDDPTWPK